MTRLPTYNQVQMLEAMDCRVVVRNDEINIEQIRDMRPSAIVISPGPGTPETAGISVEAIKFFTGKFPILGVCLGHQAIAVAFGGRVVRASQIMHGKTSWVNHNGEGIFKGLPDPFEATRYHSLVVDRRSLPDELLMNAWTENGEVMGIRHVGYASYGVQFHPESILTKEGHRILENFVDQYNV